MSETKQNPASPDGETLYDKLQRLATWLEVAETNFGGLPEGVSIREVWMTMRQAALVSAPAVSALRSAGSEIEYDLIAASHDAKWRRLRPILRKAAAHIAALERRRSLASTPRPDADAKSDNHPLTRQWGGKLSRIQAARILDRATDKDDPFWEGIVQDFYDEEADTMPTIMDVLATLGVTEAEYKKASGSQNIDWPNEVAFDADAKLAEIQEHHKRDQQWYDDDESNKFLASVWEKHSDRATLLSVASEALQESERLRAELALERWGIDEIGSGLSCEKPYDIAQMVINRRALGAAK